MTGSRSSARSCARLLSLKEAADNYQHSDAIDNVLTAYLRGYGVDRNIPEFLKYEQLGLSLQARDVYELRIDRLKNCRSTTKRCIYCRHGQVQTPLNHEAEIQTLQAAWAATQDPPGLYEMALVAKDPMPFMQPLLDIGYEKALIWYVEELLGDARRNEATIYQAFTLLLDSLNYPCRNDLRDLFKDNMTLFAPHLWNLWTEHQDLLQLQSQDLGWSAKPHCLVPRQ